MNPRDKSEIEFKNGHLYDALAPEGSELDLHETHEVFKQMERYYNSHCTVRYWLEKRGWHTRGMTVKTALWGIAEGWYPQGYIIEVEED